MGQTGPTGIQGATGPAPTVELVPNGVGGFYNDRVLIDGNIVFTVQGVTGATGPRGAQGKPGLDGATGAKVLWPMIIFGA